MQRIFFRLFLLTFLISCQKSNVQNPDIPSAVRPARSMIVTYPLEQDQYHFKQSYYRFETDSLSNGLVITGTDSTYSSSLLTYDLLRSVKTYYFSSDLPKRVEKISFRRYRQSQYGGAAYYDYGNFDLDFIYADYSSHPNQLRLTLYRDYSGLIVNNQITGVVQEFSYYFTGPFRDFVNLNNYDQVSRRSSRTESWGGTARAVYGDTLDEVTTLNSYYLPVFFNDQQAFPVDSRYIAFQTAFVYNPDLTCKTFAIDMVDNDKYGLFGQRKLDFTYSEESKSLNDYLPIYNPTDVIFWENIAARYAGGPAGANYLAGIYSDAYNYYPDLYSFYQDASASYTDSLFVVNGTTKQFSYATTYYNKIVRDSQGNISTITKTNQNDSVFRKIELFY